MVDRTPSWDVGDRGGALEGRRTVAGPLLPERYTGHCIRQVRDVPRDSDYDAQRNTTGLHQRRRKLRVTEGSTKQMNHPWKVDCGSSGQRQASPSDGQRVDGKVEETMVTRAQKQFRQPRHGYIRFPFVPNHIASAICNPSHVKHPGVVSMLMLNSPNTAGRGCHTPVGINHASDQTSEKNAGTFVGGYFLGAW